MRLVKLQARHRGRVPKQRAMRLAGAHCGQLCVRTVPKAHAAIARATGQRIVPELDAADKVRVHFPAAVLVGRHGVRKRARKLTRTAA